MRSPTVGLQLIVLSVAIVCASAEVRAEANPGAPHPCTNNPLIRSTGLFGGPQAEIFLRGTNLRREQPPAPDELTRVVDVTGLESLADPAADPFIDKCASALRPVGEGEVELTILWQNRNCPNSFDIDDPEDCASRTRFRFPLSNLGLSEPLDDFGDRVMVAAYFAQRLVPEGRHPATGMPTAVKGSVHLVARLLPLP